MGSLVFSSTDIFTGEFPAADSIQWNRRHDQACGYVWGRQDAGDGSRDTTGAHVFGTAYAMAGYLTGNYPGNLAARWHEWHVRGYILVRQANTSRIVQIAPKMIDGTTGVYAHVVPYVGEYLEYWPGLIAQHA